MGNPVDVSSGGSSAAQLVPPQNGDAVRATWGGKIEFLLTLIGCAVGLGNVWRYPYLCYENGGGAFIIPFIVCLVVIGLPLVFMELSVGQFSSLGPITMWKMNPSMKGLGYSMVMVSLLICLYYNVIIAWCIYYLFRSMASEVPWQNCNNPWNTPNCVTIESFRNAASSTNYSITISPGSLDVNSTAFFATTAIENATAANATQAIRSSPSEEFFFREVLRLSSGMSSPGALRWELVGCLALSWSLVALVVCMGIKSIGKVVWFTTLFPYALLTVLVVRTALLEGSVDGIKYYVNPQWEKLADFKVWSNAACQIFYSLGVGTGCLVAMASYNKFEHNIVRDALAVPIINVLTCIYAGFITFSVLGYMAITKKTSIDKVAAQGPGLAFIVYTEALSTMPLPPLWSILFFFMMCVLGFSSQISLVEGVLTAFLDEFPILKSTRRRELAYRLVCCVLGFLLGVPMLSEGGAFLLNLVDSFVGTYPLLLVGTFEIFVIIYIYGYEAFARDTFLMLGKKPSIYFMVTLRVITPAALIVTIILTIYRHESPVFGDYKYSSWELALGWFIVAFVAIFIPVFALKEYLGQGGFQALKASNRPHSEWGPALAVHRVGTDYDLQIRTSDVGDAEAAAAQSDHFGASTSLAKIGVGQDGAKMEAGLKPVVPSHRQGVDNTGYGSSGFGSQGSNLISMSPADVSVM